MFSSNLHLSGKRTWNIVGGSLFVAYLIGVALLITGFACLTQAQVPMTGAGKGAPGGGAITFSFAFAGNLPDTGGGSSVTYTGISFGATNTNRVIAVPIAWRANADGDTITSMTIGGVGATQATGAYVSVTGGGWISDIWYAAIGNTGGTSGNVVVNFSAASSRSDIAAYRIITGTVAPTDVQNQSGTATTLVKAITVPVSGKAFAFYGDRVGSGTNIVWTNAVSDFNDLIVGGFSDFGGATVTGTGSVTVTADNTPLNTFSTLVIAAWGP